MVVSTERKGEGAVDRVDRQFAAWGELRQAKRETTFSPTTTSSSSRSLYASHRQNLFPVGWPIKSAVDYSLANAVFLRI